MSVTLAPRARMAVNASCPGVSRKTMRRPPCSASLAPMRWVMPPRSPAATAVLRMRVEQARLAVVDVAHDGHDGGARDELVGIVFLEDGVLGGAAARVAVGLRPVAPTGRASATS